MPGHTGEYSSTQIIAMQGDAERRVREMRRLAQERVRQTQESFQQGGSPSGGAAPSNQSPNRQNAPPAQAESGSIPIRHRGQHSPPPSPPPAAAPEVCIPENLPSPPPSMGESSLRGILDRLNLDEETLLLLLLLLLLVNEGADSMLILALGYLLL